MSTDLPNSVSDNYADDDEGNQDYDNQEGDYDDDDQQPDDTSESGVDSPKYIRLRGLPWSATHQEILDFLKSISVVDAAKGIHLVTSRWDGKNTGEAYVEVATQNDVHEALRLNKAVMGHRYIEVFTATSKEAKDAMRKTSSHGTSYVVKLRGLPYAVTEQQIEEFFNGLEIKPDREGILFVMDRRGRATGEAFVQFESQEDTEQALGRNREKIGHRYIEIFRSSLAELKRASNGSGRPGPYDLKDRGSNRGAGGSDYGSGGARNMRGGNDWGNNGGSGGGGGNGFGVGANNTLGFNNLSGFTNSGNFGNGYGPPNNSGNFGGTNSGNFGNNSGGFGGNNRFNNSDNGGGNFGNDFGDFGNFGNNRNNFGGGGIIDYGNNHGGNGNGVGGNNGNFGNFGGNFGGNLGNAGNMGFNGSSVSGGGNFGPIGGGRGDNDYFTVHMRGLPYNSYENEVFKFFDPIVPANVRINFNKKGLHSGTADAIFDTYEDAQDAMKRHREQMGTRYIELFFDGKTSNKSGNCGSNNNGNMNFPRHL